MSGSQAKKADVLTTNEGKNIKQIKISDIRCGLKSLNLPKIKFQTSLTLQHFMCFIVKFSFTRVNFQHLIIMIVATFNSENYKVPKVRFYCCYQRGVRP